jgi:hypothetical protein
MLALTVLVISLQLLLLMVLLESIMYSLELVSLCFKAIKMKYPRSHSTLRVTRSSQQVVIRLAVYGQLILAMNYRS